MNGWLIVGRCPMDEIPMYFEAEEADARKMVTMIEETDVLRQARELGLDTSSCICLGLHQFRAGRLVGEYEIVRDYQS